MAWYLCVYIFNFCTNNFIYFIWFWWVDGATIYMPLKVPCYNTLVTLGKSYGVWANFDIQLSKQFCQLVHTLMRTSSPHVDPSDSGDAGEMLIVIWKPFFLKKKRETPRYYPYVNENGDLHDPPCPYSYSSSISTSIREGDASPFFFWPARLHAHFIDQFVLILVDLFTQSRPFLNFPLSTGNFGLTAEWTWWG